ncbi:hypothetical protein BC332_04853 [Capsicum chinense]|nr:hypothetical protein BC332_04853 [Capsicum chinense]
MDVDQVTCHFNCDDIIMEILCRLPVRYLVLSKLWNALISDPYVVSKHLNHVKNNPHAPKLLFCKISLADYTTSIYSCPLSSVRLGDKLQKLDPPSISRTVICCTYNGLVVIRAFGQTIQQSIHMLWNPSTRESMLLPQPEFPRQDFYCLGLGYDSTIGDYKDPKN